MAIYRRSDSERQAYLQGYRSGVNAAANLVEAYISISDPGAVVQGIRELASNTLMESMAVSQEASNAPLPVHKEVCEKCGCNVFASDFKPGEPLICLSCIPSRGRIHGED